MRFIRSKLTFANVVALLALFIALGGSAYAIHLGKNAAHHGRTTRRVCKGQRRPYTSRHTLILPIH